MAYRTLLIFIIFLSCAHGPDVFGTNTRISVRTLRSERETRSAAVRLFNYMYCIVFHDSLISYNSAFWNADRHNGIDLTILMYFFYKATARKVWFVCTQTHESPCVSIRCLKSLVTYANLSANGHEWKNAYPSSITRNVHAYQFLWSPPQKKTTTTRLATPLFPFEIISCTRSSAALGFHRIYRSLGGRHGIHS